MSNYSDPEVDDIDVHGGLTFSGMIDGGFYLGFDTAHLGDKIPGIDEGGVLRDLDYVKNECFKLSEQLYELED